MVFDPLFSSLEEFIQVIDDFEQENNKKSLIDIRQNLKRKARDSPRVNMVIQSLHRLDARDVANADLNPKKRGSKSWQIRKQEYKDRHNLSDEDWREYRNNKLILQRRNE